MRVVDWPLPGNRVDVTIVMYEYGNTPVYVLVLGLGVYVCVDLAVSSMLSSINLDTGLINFIKLHRHHN